MTATSRRARGGKHKTRDSQKWKSVETRHKRRYVQQEATAGRSSYQEDPDIGAGDMTEEDQEQQDLKEL